MHARYTYQEAQQAIAGDNLDIASPDFYRMLYAPEGSIALGLRDKATAILIDVVVNGSPQAQAQLAEAERCGYVEPMPHEGFTFYNVIDVENTAGLPEQFRSHMAMQIAFPNRYKKFFGGELVWHYSDHRIQELLSLSISTLTNTKHPSDWYGHHEIVENKDAVKSEKKKGVPGFNEWVRACQQYKADLKDAWDRYIDLCQQRKKARDDAKRWREEQIAKIDQQIEDWIAGEYDHKIEVAHEAHTDLKNKGKPQKADYV